MHYGVHAAVNVETLHRLQWNPKPPKPYIANPLTAHVVLLRVHIHLEAVLAVGQVLNPVD